MSNGYKMKMTKFILNDEGFQNSSGERMRKIQILRTGEFSDPRYDRFQITKAMLQEMVDNFSKGVRGIIPALDYKHESDDVAAGWFKKLYLDGEALWADIEMTPKGEKVLADKEFGYVSADFDTEYQDNETLQKFGCVLMGAGLTNRPVIKRMESVIQLSEKEKSESEKINEGEKQMEEKVKELEQKLAESQKMCAELQEKLDGLMKKPEEEKKPDEESKPEIEVELAAAKKELSELKGKLELTEKSGEFEKLLSEGKAVEAQRESFIKGDMKDFISKSVPIKLSEQGHGKAPEPKKEIDAQEEISALAKILSEEKKIGMKEAISEVLRNNPKLAEKISN
jgi:phage I-like protein